MRPGTWLVVSIGMLAACSTPPALPISEQKQAAVASNRRAEAAWRAGELTDALVFYQQALAVNRSIEDAEGVATELMNVSAVYRQLGERARSYETLDEILITPAIPFAGAQRAEAAYRKASFLVDDDRLREAGEWLDRVGAHCGGGDCAAEGKTLNLRARLAIERKDFAAALAYARAAQPINGRHADRAELANSLRLTGDALLWLAEPVQARGAYLQALELDKVLGAGRKIALDLIGAGSSLLSEGRRSEAADYLRRARSVAEGVADQDILASVDRLLARAGIPGR